MQISKDKFQALYSGSSNEQHRHSQEVNDGAVLMQKLALRQGGSWTISQQYNATARKTNIILQHIKHYHLLMLEKQCFCST